MLVTHTDDLLHLQLHTVGSNFLHFLRSVYDLLLDFYLNLIGCVLQCCNTAYIQNSWPELHFSVVVLAVISSSTRGFQMHYCRVMNCHPYVKHCS